MPHPPLPEFLHQQLSSWPLAHYNYQALQQIRRRTLTPAGVTVHLQYNPLRIASTAAKVDASSIQARRCFLCPDNLPLEQKRLSLPDGFQLLVNPYPIFDQHLTIPTLTHEPQRIAHSFASILGLAKMFPEMVIFYNGPRCGASAPDHLHFQAGNKGFLPLEADYRSGQWTLLSENIHEVTIRPWQGYLRGIISMESHCLKKLAHLFHCFCNTLKARQPDLEEPMMNLLCHYDTDRWVVHILPRTAHRPRQYEATGSEQMVISPASVDLAGVVILPREEDFMKMTEELLIDIFKQVSPDDQTIIDIVQTTIERCRTTSGF
ncbi:MAG: DUF4922 domain-containing protein [Marinilabiliaceae bacterium]|nr:DUF4922 domain-containing protein [Marinilabiliaceae bacterium]